LIPFDLLAAVQDSGLFGIFMVSRAKISELTPSWPQLLDHIFAPGAIVSPVYVIRHIFPLLALPFECWVYPGYVCPICLNGMCMQFC
jgi:hypothetical protein